MRRRSRPLAIAALIGVVALGAVGVATRLTGPPAPGVPSGASAALASTGDGAGASATPSATAMVSWPTPVTISPSASASPSIPSPGASNPPSAPTSAVGFKLRKTIVPMSFPLPASPKHRYLDGWLARRAGTTYPYEEAIGRAADGTLRRGHDGVDIAIPVGVSVLAVFDGIVVDPRTRWTPWDPTRYGKVVVIRSTEAASGGYYAIAAHLSKVSVGVGDRVTRGEVVGKTGRTGNAAAVPMAHLHFELRAPFRIEQHWGGIRRRLDVFDPKPSLLAADPARA